MREKGHAGQAWASVGKEDSEMIIRADSGQLGMGRLLILKFGIMGGWAHYLRSTTKVKPREFVSREKKKNHMEAKNNILGRLDDSYLLESLFGYLGFSSWKPI